MLSQTGTLLEQFCEGNQQGMRKKNLPSYKPARLVMGTSRTYIALKYTRKDGKYVPGKPTYQLGRIWNMEQRRKRGEAIVEKINWWLSQGYYFEDFEEMKVTVEIKKIEEANIDKQAVKQNELRNTNVIDAIEIARSIKVSKTKKRSVINTANSKARLLTWFLNDRGMWGMTVAEFSKADIAKYLLYYKTERKGRKGKPIGNTTYNNVILHNSQMWTELVTAGYISENPWHNLPHLDPEDKQRRPFELHEAKIALDYFYKKDRLTYYGAIIIFLTGIRPVELVGLRFKDISLIEGTIRVHGDNSKLNTYRHSTIPDDYLEIFTEDFWLNYPRNYYIFGENMQPHPSIMAGKETLKTRHRKYINHLFEEGYLIDVEGLTFYSWKDTGAGEIIDLLGLEVAQIQFGHAHPETTLLYKKKEKINKKMLKLKRNII